LNIVVRKILTKPKVKTKPRLTLTEPN
jgi:hypothetical protein